MTYKSALITGTGNLWKWTAQYWALHVIPLQIEVYKDRYVQAFRANLVSYSEAQIHHSKQSHDTLSKLRDELAAIQLDWVLAVAGKWKVFW